jgi:hypothetical protein
MATYPPVNPIAADFRPNAGLSARGLRRRSRLPSNFAQDGLGWLAWAATRTGTVLKYPGFRS